MGNARAKINCPNCHHDVGFDMSRSNYIRQREGEFQTRENQLRERERNLRVREDGHVADVRLIKSCLHPDKHPEQNDRYTKAWQAFERLLASAAKPEPVAEFDDNIPF
jgi:hypothetical protein